MTLDQIVTFNRLRSDPQEVVAEELGVTQSCVSRRIKALERELGVRLFDGEGQFGRRTLTPAGFIAADYCRQIETAAEHMKIRLSKMEKA